MATNQQQQLPVWIVKWRMPSRGRGRKHAAMFIPNSAFIRVHPISGVKCEGTVYHVSGSPFGGFALNVRRNWDAGKSASLESASQVCEIDQQFIWIPTVTEYLADDMHRRAEVDRYAHNVRPPGVTSRPWIAEEVMDCQDWLVSLVEHMVQRRVIPIQALQATRDVMDAKTALMPTPAGAPTVPGQSSSARPITASTIQAPRLKPQHLVQPAQPHAPSHSSPGHSSAQQQVGQSEWRADRSRFERYNHTTARWEYYDNRSWIPYT
nr:hypothetical protein CFP56_02720 [Quercus suber]